MTACHRCHDPAHGINGILILDRNVAPLREAMNRDLRWMVAGSGALTLLLVAGIAGIVPASWCSSGCSASRRRRG